MPDNLQEKLFAEEKPRSMRVLVPYPVDKAYDYIVPSNLSVSVGDYVCVPLGSREINGVVWGEAAADFDPKKLKKIIYRYDIDPMPKEHRDFIDWVAHYTLAMKGSVLKMSLSSPAAFNPPKPKVGYVLVKKYPLPTSPLKGGGVATIHSLPTSGGGLGRGILDKSRELRSNMTEAENKLWYHLRKKNLGAKFRRQRPMGSYIVDFVCLEKHLIIELDGGQHADQAVYDKKRTKFLEQQGYRVIRYWNNEVLGNIDGVLADIVSNMKTLPSPNLPPTGGGMSRVSEAKPNFTRSWEGGQKLSPQRQKVLEVMQDGKTRIASEIADMAGCSAAVIKGMADKGMLEAVSVYNPAPCMYPDFEHGSNDLSENQQMIADELCDDVSSVEFRPSLLDGVTGAGKTEVYFEGVAQALKEGKQVVIMLPEIALSNAFLERFKSRFGCAPALWHSHLTPAQRRTTWRGVASGDTRVVVGARSALFLPYKNLGMIIVDEEHDPAYKQEDGVIYNARDMAVVRAFLSEIPVCLVSATPSLETMMNAWEEPLGSGRYKHLVLESRYGGAVLPDISVVDLRADKPDRGCFLSSAVLGELQKNLDAGEQSLLFLNRRGYAPLTLCRTCGHRMECPRCTAWLVEHRSSGRLHCHHCGHHVSIPKNCPECEDLDSLAACGPGVERIFEEAKANFPEARIMILASDMAESNEEMKNMLARIIAGEVDIIIGTQIIAKGHHFPNLTFVAIIDADLGLKGGDLRAAERTYQMLTQVAGRAGREQKRGRVLLQSWMPDHRIMQAMASSSSNNQTSPHNQISPHPNPPPNGGREENTHNTSPLQGGGWEGGASSRDEFLSVELAEREAAHMPPFSRLAGIIISGRDERQVMDTAKALGRTAPQGITEAGHRIQTLGPAPAPLARLRGKHRHRLLVRADKEINIQKTLSAWVGAVKVPSNVRVYIDIDPQSFL